MGHPPATCAALVADLQPPVPTLEWFEEVRKVREGIPIILYLPVKTGVDSSLHQASMLGLDGLIFARAKADERERLAAALKRVLATGNVASLLDQLAASVPARSIIGFRILKHFGIKMAGTIDASDHVKEVAAALGTTPRSLQRSLRADGWPNPKELLDWMMLFLTSLSGNLPTEKTARRRVQRAADRLLGLSGLEEPPDTAVITAAFLQSITPAR
jgi:hypothetical protein